MYCYPKGTDIVIYGSDNKYTRKLIIEYGNYYKIHYIAEHLNPVDENAKILGIPVRYVGKDFYAEKCEYKIIVAYGVPDALTVFKKNGFVPMDEYAPSWLLCYEDIDYLKLVDWFGVDRVGNIIRFLLHGKKGVILHGNCQTRLIDIYLKSNPYFKSNYCIVKIPRIFEYNAEKTDAVQSRELWDNIDLLIQHYIKSDNKFSPLLASEHFKSLMKPDTKSLYISNLWYTGYFPQRVPQSKNILTDIQQSGLFPNGDCNIDRMVGEGKSVEEIVKCLSSSDFYLPETVKKNSEESFNSLEQREKDCDIKMLDFLKREYRNNLLFHSPNHPTHYVMKELTIRILTSLGADDVSFCNEWWCKHMWNLRGQDLPIYPSVVKALKLRLPVKNIDDMVYFTNKDIDPKPYSFDEWVEKYALTCFYEKHRL